MIMEHTKLFTIASWAMRLVAAVILLQTLFFKFTGAKESVYIFTTLGMEPWGRIGSGVAELIASILLLMPRTVFWGAAISIVVMGGAIVSHLTVLGVKLPAVDDNGELFALALVVLACSIGALILHRHEIPFLASTQALSRES